MNSRIDDVDFSPDIRCVRGAARMNFPVNLRIVLLGSDRGPPMYLKGGIDRTGRVVVVEYYRAAAAERAVTGFRRQLSNLDTGRRRQQAHLEISNCYANRNDITASAGNSYSPVNRRMERGASQFEIGLQQAGRISQRFWCNTAKRREPYPGAVHTHFLIVADRRGEAVGPVKAHRNIAAEPELMVLVLMECCIHRRC